MDPFRGTASVFLDFLHILPIEGLDHCKRTKASFLYTYSNVHYTKLYPNLNESFRNDAGPSRIREVCKNEHKKLNHDCVWLKRL